MPLGALVAACLFTSAAGLGLVRTVFAAEPIMVSQKGRAFNPASLDIAQGQTVTIVNDDGDLLHHAYVDAPAFSFDSGDQEPGSRTAVVFSKPGTFTVLCGIHPKMKMVVHVQ